MARTNKCEKFEMFYHVSFESVVREHHVYKGKWSPEKGERLLCQKDLREEAEEHDAHVIGVYKKERDDWPGEVGHAPIELSKLLSQFLGSDK